MQQSASKAAGAAPNRRSSSTTGDPAASAAQGGSFLTKYFMLILFGFACLSLALNSRFAHIVVEDVSIIESVLQNSVQQLSLTSQQHPVLDDDHAKTADEQERLEALHHKELEKHHAEQEKSESFHHEPENTVHKIANLNCGAFGGPSEEKAQEMVYWEDIPKDAEYMSPFHRKKRLGDGTKMTMTQFLTFEPDHVSEKLWIFLCV